MAEHSVSWLHPSCARVVTMGIGREEEGSSCRDAVLCLRGGRVHYCLPTEGETEAGRKEEIHPCSQRGFALGRHCPCPSAGTALSGCPGQRLAAQHAETWPQLLCFCRQSCLQGSCDQSTDVSCCWCRHSPAGCSELIPSHPDIMQPASKGERLAGEPGDRLRSAPRHLSPAADAAGAGRVSTALN